MEMRTYNLKNPTAHRRVFYDGSEQQNEIRIDPGQVIRNVQLADHVIQLLQNAHDHQARLGKEHAEVEYELVDTDPTLLPVPAKPGKGKRAAA